MSPYFWLIETKHEKVLVFGNQEKHQHWSSILTILRMRGYVIYAIAGKIVKNDEEWRTFLDMSDKDIKCDIEYRLKQNYNCKNYEFESLFTNDAEEVNLFGKCISSIFRKSKNVSVYDGCTCKVCNVFYPYAISNQDDGSLICWSCRNTN